MTETVSRDTIDQMNEDQRSARDGERARKFRSHLSPELLLRWLVIRDGPFLPGGRFVGMATAPARCEPNMLQMAKRLVESWPAGFILPAKAGSGQAGLPGLLVRSLTLSGLVRRALIAVPSAECPEWINSLETSFLIRFTQADTTTSNSPNDPALIVVPINALADGAPNEDQPSSIDWDITLIDGTGTELSMETMEDIRERSRAMLTVTGPNAAGERGFGLTRLCRRTGSFSLDDGITREYHRLIEEFETAESRIPEHDIQFLRRAVGEIRDLDPDYWDVMMNALGGSGQAILKRWIRTGGALNPEDASAILFALRLAAPRACHYSTVDSLSGPRLLKAL